MKEADILDLVYKYNACYIQDEPVIIDFLDRIAKDQITKDDFEGLKGIWLLNILYIIASDDVRPDMRHIKMYVYMHNKAVNLIREFAEDVKLFNNYFIRGFAIPKYPNEYKKLLTEYPQYSKYIFNGVSDYYMKFGFLRNLIIEEPMYYSTLYDGHISKKMKMKINFHSVLGKVSLKKLEDLTKVMAQCLNKKELDLCAEWKAIRIYNLTDDDRYRRPTIPYNERKYATRDGYNDDVEDLVELLNKRRRDQGINKLIVIDESDEGSSQSGQSSYTDYIAKSDYITDEYSTDSVTDSVTDEYSTYESSDYSSHTDHTDSVAKGDYTDYSSRSLSETSRTSETSRRSRTSESSKRSRNSETSKRNGMSETSSRTNETSRRTSETSETSRTRAPINTNEEIDLLEDALGDIMGVV